MDKKPKIKLTENKSNQINISDSLNSIYANRKTIKIKTKKKLFLSEEKENNIKNANSNNNILFPKIKNDVIYNMKQSHKNLSINNSFSNNIQTIGKSFSNKINYSNSIDVSNKKRFKNLKLNILNNNNIKLNLLKIQNKKENDQLYEIKNFMKMKYYEDTSAKMEKELKDDSFVDRRDKDKLIQIGKFHVFWKNVLDYCGGYIFTQRMKNLSLQNSSNDSKNKIKLKKIPNNRVYTSILRSKLIHYKNDS